MFERVPTPEFSDLELQLIQKLKENGPDDAEARKLLNAWLDAQEARANEINTSRANIELNLKRAKLYAAAGFAENARENAEAVMIQASQEGESDLYEGALSLLDTFKKSS